MCNLILAKKSGLFLMTGFLFIISFTSLYAQQDIIINKDNTRPETMRQLNSTYVSSLMIARHNGYNEIRWSTPGETTAPKLFIEYSFDGINFLSAGQVLSTDGNYNYKHYIMDTRPLLYRIRIGTIGENLSYSKPVLLDGIDIPPVQIYTTIVKGNTVNARAQFPVEKVTIVSGDGLQVFTKDINGSRDFIPIVIPSLNRGLYFITFYGNDWKSTSRFFYHS